MINDRFESEWVPSHEPESLENQTKLEPWNTVGIPLSRNSIRGNRETDNKIVRKAVRDIESGLYSSGHQDRRKEVVEEKIDVTQARLYWQEKERGSHDQDTRVPVAIDYRTDYPGEGERDENVIVLKVDQSDGLILKPNKPIILTPIEPREAVKSRKKSVDEESAGESEKENLPSYEENWSQKRRDFWSCDVTRNSRRRAKEEEEERLGEVASRVLKFETTGYPNEIGQIKSQIPRIKAVKTCEFCKKMAVVDTCSKCGAVKSREVRKSGNYSSTDSKSRKKKTTSKEKTSKERLLISVDSQRSRTNFFGNTGSYTLRCNLNPVTKVTYNKKRFYLTPETLQLDYLKKLKEPKIFYENFAAKKREFLKQKTDHSINRLDGYEKKSEAGLW